MIMLVQQITLRGKSEGIIVFTLRKQYISAFQIKGTESRDFFVHDILKYRILFARGKYQWQHLEKIL